MQIENSLQRDLRGVLCSVIHQTILAILIHRHRNHGLLLSELDGYLLLWPAFTSCLSSPCCQHPWLIGCCSISAPEWESGAGMLRLRFIACALLFLFSSSRISW